MVVRPFRGKNEQRFFIRDGIMHNAINPNLCIAKLAQEGSTEYSWNLQSCAFKTDKNQTDEQDKPNSENLL